MSEKKISFAQAFLFFLEKTVEGGEFVLNTSQDLRDWAYEVYGHYPQKKDRYALSQAIKRLRKRGLIEKEERGENEIILKLTDKGREKALFESSHGFKWDGRWRIVIFDIPESKKSVRNIFRWKLKSWGFVKWQKSVWASKKNITEPMRELTKELEIDDWVLVLESDNVGF